MFTSVMTKIRNTGDDNAPDTRKCVLYQTPMGWYNTAPIQMTEAEVKDNSIQIAEIMNSGNSLIFATEEGRTIIIPAHIVQRSVASIIDYADLYDIVDVEDVDDYDSDDDDDDDDED